MKRNKNKVSKSRSSHVLRKKHLSLGLLSTPLSDSSPTCHRGWPRNSSLVPSFSSQISAWDIPVLLISS